MKNFGPELIGKRVSVRIFDSGGGFRDLLGTYVAEFTIEVKSGEVITFNPKDVFVWKEVLERDSGE
ncbi:MAG: hypothetical protein RL301_244 [Actinomycetota bacterium]|jgi:hypothetical protein